MSRPERGPVVVVHRDADVLAAAVAARLLTRLIDAQSSRGSASVVLTGGGVGISVLEHVRRSPALHGVDWGQVDVWWGDERFVPATDPDRNAQQAREALLDHVDVDPTKVHEIPASDAIADIEAAAASYAEELRRLDADEVYAGALAAVTGATGLSDRPASRNHVWHDPSDGDDPGSAVPRS